jgi:hypothetical protein
MERRGVGVAISSASQRHHDPANPESENREERSYIQRGRAQMARQDRHAHVEDPEIRAQTAKCESARLQSIMAGPRCKPTTDRRSR